MITYNTLADAEAGLRNWLQGLTGLTAMQPGNNPAVKDEHILFQLIDMTAAEFVCSDYTYDEPGDQYQKCTVSEYAVTYQIDAVYCNTGPDAIIKILRGFKSGLYRSFEYAVNFGYSDNSIVRQVNFQRNQQQHFKYTVDVSFLFRCLECVDIEAIEVVNIAACPEFPNDFISDLQVTKP